MCRIDERVYVRTDGHRTVFEDTVLCDKGRRRGKTCSDAKIRRTEYPDPTSSPITSSPLTPTYNTRTRRPSVSSRPSTRDGPITSLKPEIHIEIGSKKGKGKNYVPTVSITTGKSKRASTGSTSGSEASHTVRTGFPDISPPSLESGRIGLRPHFGQQRNQSSDESFSGSSRVPSLYRNSDDYDTPSLVTTTTGTSSGNHPIIHNGTRHVPSPIDNMRGYSGSPSSPYRTTEFRPRATFNDPSDRTERDWPKDSSHAPEIIGRDEDRQRRRDEQRRRQEVVDYEIAANLLREENQKHVRFENRTKILAEEQSQNSFAAREQRHADERERERERLRQEKEKEARANREAATKAAATKRSKTSATNTRSRRGSVQMTAAQAAEQQHLVAAEAYQMHQERIKADAIEREEQRLQPQQPSFQQHQPTSLQERQQDPGYYDPRAGRSTQPSSQAPVIRRPSQTGQPRPNLGRRNSTRESAVPQIRQDRRQPPIAFYNTTAARPDLPQAREPQPLSSHGTNPFAPPTPAVDPWDLRNVGQALPNARGPQVGHNFPQPQQATHRLNQAFYHSEYETDSKDEGYNKKR